MYDGYDHGVDAFHYHFLTKVKNMNKRWWILILGITMLSGCGEKTQLTLGKHVQSVPPRYAKLISGLPANYHYYKDPIQIHFAKTVVGSNRVNAPETRHLLDFTPKVEGQLFWVGRETLEFRPKTTFPMHQQMQAQLWLKAFDTGLDLPLSFTFETECRRQKAELFYRRQNRFPARGQTRGFGKGHVVNEQWA